MRFSRPLAVAPSSGAPSRRWARAACCGLAVVAVVCGAGPAAAQAAGAAAARTFDVEAYDVDGVKLLKDVDVEAAVYPFMGPGRTAADIDQARQALEKVYHDRGFQTVVVELPAQTVSDNIVRLHVVEASVGRLRVTGARFFSPEFVRSQAPAFKENQVPDVAEAQKELAAINRLPDRRVTPVLRAGEVPGTVDVNLQVADSLPLHGSLELNNDHNQGTPPLRLTATGHYDNLWQLGHSLSATYSVAPENRATSEIFAGSYLAPVWGSPWSILAYGYSSNSNVATLGGTDVLGKGYAIGLKGILQLPSRGSLSQSFSFGVDLKHFDENISLASSSTADTVVYWPFNLAYNIQRDGPRFSTKGSLAVTIGMRGIGSDTAQFENKRFDANANFVHLNLELTQTEALWHGVQAVQRLAGQFSDQPLVSSEEFASGGLSSVRGYLQSEATGDDGFYGSLEFHSPSLAGRFGPLVDQLRFYVFADGAVVRTQSALPGQTTSSDLVSSGVGMHLEMLRHFKGDLIGAVPFIAGAATPADHPRLTFSVKSEF
jgi:hemolysin activation/secretion protein